MSRIPVLFFLLILGACCEDSVLTGHSKVGETQEDALPHKINSSYTFTAPNNQTFELSYAGERLTTERYGGDHCGDPYTMVDFYYREFQSTFPDLFVTFGLQGDFAPYVSIAINKSQFGVVTTLNPDIDTITINGVLYADVYTPEVLYADTTAFFYDKIWYNQAHGLLQFTTNNGQVFKRK